MVSISASGATLLKRVVAMESQIDGTIEERIGSLEDKISDVEAASVSDTRISSAVSDYLTSNPITGLMSDIASINLSSHRIVIKSVGGLIYPSIAGMNDGDSIVGITISSVNYGDVARYKFEGFLADPSWNWSPGPIFCGDSGIMTQTVPLTGNWLRQIATAIDGQTIAINLFPTYYIAQGY